MIGALSAPDPYIFTDSGAGQQAFRDTNGKAMVASTFGAGTIFLLVVGQSNVCNVGPTTYVVTNTGKVLTFNLCDGATYTAVGPMLACSTQFAGGIPFGRNFAPVLADLLINAGKATKVGIACIGVGSTFVAGWQSLNPSTRIQAIYNRLTARSIVPSAILWGQGESDTGAGTTQTDYQNSLTAVIASFRTVGFSSSIPFFVAQQTWFGGATSAGIRAAQAAVVNHGSGIWAGPDSDTLNAGNRQAGNTDFNDAGVDAYAALWQTALGLYGAPF